jgi:hypothetical protein
VINLRESNRESTFSSFFGAKVSSRLPGISLRSRHGVSTLISLSLVSEELVLIIEASFLPANAFEKLLHPVLLAGWMLTIGELLALDELAAHCEKENRWTFFFSAVPLKVEQGLASTGQTLAIF